VDLRTVVAAAVVALFGMLYFGPILRLLMLGFIGADGRVTLAPVEHVFATDFYVFTLTNTVRLSAIVTVLCVVLAYPVSHLMAITQGNRFRSIIICVILPLWISVVVKAYAWLVILQQKGIVNSVLLALGVINSPLSLVFGDFAVIIGSVHMMLPFAILPIYAALRRINPSFYTAAVGLGASPAKAVLHVIVPLSLPGVAAGALIVFVLELGFFVTPAILGGGQVLMIAPVIQKQIEAASNWGVVAVLSIILLSITAVAIILSDQLFRTPKRA
jgi:putative spermidine/putrescine transport system permease protein